MQISGIPGFIGRAFGSLRTGASAGMNATAGAVLAVAAIYRIHLAVTADRISVFTILPAHGEMGTYNYMAANRYIDTVTGPLYPGFLMFMRLFDQDGGFRAVFVIQGLVIVLCAAFAGIIATRLANRKAGMAALVIVSAYLSYILYGLVSLPVVFCILIVFLMMLVLSADNGDGEWDTPGSVISGILGATALLLHPVMIYLLPGLFAAVRKRMLMASILLVIVVPWGVRNSMLAARPVPVYESTAYELAGMETVRTGSGWKVVDDLYFNVSFLMKKSVERAHMPILFGKRDTNKHVLEYTFVIVALLGLTGLIRYSDRSQIRTLLPTASYVILTLLITRYTTRSRVIFEPALLIYAGITVGGILKWMSSKGKGSGEVTP
jgi:hypothetical protein